MFALLFQSERTDGAVLVFDWEGHGLKRHIINRTQPKLTQAAIFHQRTHFFHV